MNAHRIETTLNENGTLTLHDLPFDAGATVEVIVRETNGKDRVNGASTPSQDAAAKNENWLEDFTAAIDKFWAHEGERPDIPRDWGENFDKYKRTLFTPSKDENGS